MSASIRVWREGLLQRVFALLVPLGPVESLCPRDGEGGRRSASLEAPLSLVLSAQPVRFT